MIMMPYGRCRSSLQLTGTHTSGTPQANTADEPVRASHKGSTPYWLSQPGAAGRNRNDGPADRRTEP